MMIDSKDKCKKYFVFFLLMVIIIIYLKGSWAWSLYSRPSTPSQQKAEKKKENMRNF